MNVILDNIVLILTSLSTCGFSLAWFFERNKRKIDETKLQAEALKTIQEAYDTFTRDSLERYSLLKGEVEILKKELALVKEELIIERNSHNTLKKKYDSLNYKNGR